MHHWRIIIELTSESPVYSLDSLVQHTEASPLNPAACSDSGPVQSDGRGWTSELRQQLYSEPLRVHSQQICYQTMNNVSYNETDPLNYNHTWTHDDKTGRCSDEHVIFTSVVHSCSSFLIQNLLLQSGFNNVYGLLVESDPTVTVNISCLEDKL